MIEHAEILKAVEERRQAERERRKQKDTAPVEISSKFIRDCLYSNELGDGVLYAEINRGKFVFNKTSGEWYRWGGHKWERDIEGHSLAAVETVNEQYLKETQGLVREITSCLDKDLAIKLRRTQDLLYSRIARLRSERGRSNCLKFAHTNSVNQLSIVGEIFDTHNWLLPCKNGVIDLRTGELRDGRPEDYMSKGSPIEYKGLNEPAPLWERSLIEIMDKNEALVEFLAKVIGYSATGHVKENIMPVLCGQGRNGKTIIIEAVCDVLGDIAGPIQPEMLLDQGRSKNSSGPSPDIMALRGMRLVYGSESDDGRRFSPSKVKWLSGGDKLVGRAPHDRVETRFKPTHSLILLTNNKPHAPAEDFAFWERVRLIPFPLSFVKDREPQEENERKADVDIPEKLKAEYPGILAWIVRGCLKWQQTGLEPPTIVRDATAEYRRDEDLLADWQDECCYKSPEVEDTAAELYTSFQTWWEENVSKRVPSRKKFGQWMAKKGFKKQKIGTYKYFGIRLLRETEEPF